MKRIPVDVRERMVGLSLAIPLGDERVPYRVTDKTTTLRFSLRTSDPSEVKVRHGEVTAYLETLWASLRSSKPITLTHRQCVALSGELYRAWADSERTRTIAVQFAANDPGAAVTVEEGGLLPSEVWQGVLDKLGPPDSDGEVEVLEATFGPLVDHVLRSWGLGDVDAPSRAMILQEFHRALRDAFEVQRRQASGDYAPDPRQNRFPEFDPPKPIAAIGGSKGPNASAERASIKGLVESWWVEAKAAGRSLSTYDSYRATLHRFAKHLKHDDARRVTNADVVAFKDARLAAGVSLATIRDSDLSALKVVFGWAVGNGVVQSNPALGLKIVRPQRTTTRPDGFTTEEANAILGKSLAHQGAAYEKRETTAAKRWVPWLCAYTGARVGEIVQLRKEDVSQEDGHWAITITPEAGTVKNKRARQVVLHPHLIEMGFPAFVGSAKAGHLFFAAKADEDTRGKRRATKNRLAEFAREVVPDERVKPNHGWRHLFTTRCREAGIEDSVIYAIGGWTPGNVGGRYGHVSLTAQGKAIERLPRFEVG